MWANRILLLLIVIIPAASTAPADDLKIDRWELTNTKFYDDLSAAAPVGQKLYRLKRAAAADEGAERCVKEWQESTVKKKALGPFCQALFAEIAPTFRIVLHSEATEAVVLQDINIEVRSASVLKNGHGFFADEAYYDLFIKAAPGQSSSKMRQPLKFTTLGSVDLRLGFDLSPLGPATPAAAIEFILTFNVEGKNGTEAVKTGLIRIEI
jgi:hypothetical protein